MTHLIDKSALVAEIERLKNEYLKHSRNKFHAEWSCGTLDNILSFLNTLEVKELQKEPVSEELEDAAFDYTEACKYEGGEKLLCVEHFKAGAKWQFNQLEKNRLKHCNSITNEQAELEQGFIDQHLDKHQRMPTFLDAIEYGMILQKQKMMAKAIDVEVKVDAGGYPYIPQIQLYDYDKDIPLAKKGDRYKVVLIKEE